jgi:hypothetical protein
VVALLIRQKRVPLVLESRSLPQVVVSRLRVSPQPVQQQQERPLQLGGRRMPERLQAGER